MLSWLGRAAAHASIYNEETALRQCTACDPKLDLTCERWWSFGSRRRGYTTLARSRVAGEPWPEGEPRMGSEDEEEDGRMMHIEVIA
jgi:hypothetical protein